MCKDRFAKVEAEALRLNDELWLDTIRYFRNANEIYRRYDDWKGIDRFYFIPLKLSMSYCIAGRCLRMAEPPVYLGTFIRNTYEHEDLFTAPCPVCGKKLYAYGYNGSPLSGRIDLEATCPDCGWSDSIITSGWHQRSAALRATQQGDRERLGKAQADWERLRRVQMEQRKPASIRDLLDFLRE